MSQLPVEGAPPLSPASPKGSLSPGFRRSLYAMLGIASVNLLVALDQTVISTALPTIVAELKGFEWYAWIAIAYLLGSLIAIPIFGRLGDLFGRKPFIVASMTLFTAASVMCAISPNIVALTGARLVQGVAGGMMVGTAYAALADLFPDARARLRWQMVLAISYGVATAAGPGLGGLLSETVGWRATFLVNVPVGLVGLIFTVRHMPHYPGTLNGTAGAWAMLDWAGAGWLVAMLGALQLAVHRLPRHGLDMGTIALCGTVLGTAVLLIATERRARHPLLPLDLFTRARHAVFLVLSIVCGTALFSLIFFVPLLLQTGLAMTPQQAGLAMTPLPVCLAIGSILNSVVVVHLKRPASMLMAGYTLLFTCFAALFLMEARAIGWRLAVPLGCGGLGLGLLLNNLNVFGQQVVGRARYGIFTALLQSTRMLGGMLGTAVLGAWVSHSCRTGIMRLAPLQASETDSFTGLQWLLNRSRHFGPTVQESAVGSPSIVAVQDLLVDAVRQGFLWLALLSVVALMLLRALPSITLAPRP